MKDLLALGIELGSTRIKAVAIDGTYRPAVSGEYTWENRLENGYWTYSLEEVWTGLRAALAELSGREPAVMGISGMMHGYLAFDRDWNLLTPFRTWRNTTTGPAAAELTEAIAFNIPQRWSAAHLYQAILNGEPHVSQAAHITTLAGYVHYRLTGINVLGIGDASGMFPIDSDTLTYRQDLLERPLSRVYQAIDMVVTPAGAPVAMVHCNTCTSDLDAWVRVFGEALEAAGAGLDKPVLYGLLYRKALEGDADCGGLTAFNCYSGEPVAGVDSGCPLLMRPPEARLSLANLMRAHLYAAMAALKMGMDLLTGEERVTLDQLQGHGGLFKTPGAAQRLMAGALGVPVAVMETAGEGGPWGMALLAAYKIQRTGTQPLDVYLAQRVFPGVPCRRVEPQADDRAGFEAYMTRYRAALDVERAAGELDLRRFISLSTQRVPVLVSAHALQLLERPGEMGGIRIAHGLADLPDLQAGVGQHKLCLADADGVEDVVEALPLVAVEQLGQVPLGHVATVRHRLEAQLLLVVLLHIIQRLINDEAARALGGLILRLLTGGDLPPPIQLLHHGLQGLLDLVHLGGLQQEPGHPQPDGLLGVGEVPVARQDRHLQVRKFAA